MIAQRIEAGRVILEEVLQALGNRRFVRCPVDRSDDLETILQTTIAKGDPIRVVLLWGKGRKRQPDSAEQHAAQFMDRYAEGVQHAWWPGVRYSVLFADTHARLNGYDHTESLRYFQRARATLASVVEDFGFLSDLWGAEIGWDALARQAAALDGREWALLDSRMNLLSGAIRNSVRGEPERLARLYYVVRRVEAALLTRAFSGWLYATYEGPERDSVQPDLPSLHLYSWARGRSVRPWSAVIPEISCPQGANALQPCVA